MTHQGLYFRPTGWVNQGVLETQLIPEGFDDETEDVAFLLDRVRRCGRLDVLPAVLDGSLDSHGPIYWPFRFRALRELPIRHAEPLFAKWDRLAGEAVERAAAELMAAAAQ